MATGLLYFLHNACSPRHLLLRYRLLPECSKPSPGKQRCPDAQTALSWHATALLTEILAALCKLELHSVAGSGSNRLI